MSEQNTQLGTEKISKLLFRLAVPTVAAQIVNMLYNIVDRIYIGHIPVEGAKALTGLGICFPIITLIMAFSSLIGVGGAPRAAIAMGKKDIKTAEETMGNCVATLLVLAGVLTIVFFVWAEELLYIFGASDATIGYGKSYLQIYLLGTIAVMVSLGLNTFITTQGFTKVSMMTVLIGAGLNIVLDPVFIFAFNMGVKGAALATIISQFVSAIWVLKFLSGKKTILKIKREYLKFDWKIMAPVLALGLSPFIMTSTESLLNICFNSSLQKYGGDLAVGAMTILSSSMQMFVLPLQGLAQGAQPIVSYNYGANNVKRIKETFKLLAISACVFAAVVWLTVINFPTTITAFFTADQELVEYAGWALRIYLFMGITMGAQFSCQQTFIALGEAKISLFLALVRKIFLLIPLIYILPNFFENRVFAVFLAEPIADTLAVIITITLFYNRFKQIVKEKSE